MHTKTRAQVDAAALDYAALSADLARHFPSRTPEQITRLTSIVATSAMIESESLTLHLMDMAAITLQAESAVADVKDQT